MKNDRMRRRMAWMMVFGLLLVPLVSLAEVVAAQPVAPTWQESLLSLLAAALSAGVVWALRALTAWLSSQTDRNRLLGALSRATHLAELVVVDLERTVRPKLAAALADGKLTPEEAEKLRAEAIERVKDTLGTHGMEELRAALGIVDLDAYLGSLVETVVGRLKHQAAPPAPAAPSP